jgi:hypothetical protein
MVGTLTHLVTELKVSKEEAYELDTSTNHTMQHTEWGKYFFQCMKMFNLYSSFFEQRKKKKKGGNTDEFSIQQGISYV